MFGNMFGSYIRKQSLKAKLKTRVKRGKGKKTVVGRGGVLKDALWTK